MNQMNPDHNGPRRNYEPRNVPSNEHVIESSQLPASLARILNAAIDPLASRGMRVKALDALADYKDPRVLPTLIEALDGPRWTGGVRNWSEVLWSNDWRTKMTHHSRPIDGRAKIIETIGRFETAAKTTVPVLLKLLVDQDHDVKMSAYYALEKIKDPDSLREMLRHGAKLNCNRLRTVDEFGAGAQPLLFQCVETIKTGSLEKRKESAELLGFFINKQALTALHHAMHVDNSAAVRCAAVWSLQKIVSCSSRHEIEPAESLSPLAEALHDTDSSVRKAALEGLTAVGKKVGGAKVVAPITEALLDEDEWVRKEAAEALKTLRPDSQAAIPRVKQFLKPQNLAEFIGFDPTGRRTFLKALLKELR